MNQLEEKVLSLYDSGIKSRTEIAKILNSKGYTNNAGKEISRASISYILKKSGRLSESNNVYSRMAARLSKISDLHDEQTRLLSQINEAQHKFYENRKLMVHELRELNKYSVNVSAPVIKSGSLMPLEKHYRNELAKYISDTTDHYKILLNEDGGKIANSIYTTLARTLSDKYLIDIIHMAQEHKPGTHRRYKTIDILERECLCEEALNIAKHIYGTKEKGWKDGNAPEIQ